MKKVSEQETLTGIVIVCFWWAQDRCHADFVLERECKPATDWNPTENVHMAFHWNSKPAAYKFLRENPALAAEGYQVIDLHDLGWPRLVPA